MVQIILASSEDHDRRGRLAANCPAYLQAAQAGQHQIEYHQRRFEAQKGLQCLVTPVHTVHLEAVLG
ncbi:hypothetical protein D3C77_576400 [compost metagenome]